MTHERNDGLVAEKDEARTPESLFKILDGMFQFQVDVAATQDNTLCPGYFTKEDDALSMDTWISDDYDDDDVVIPGGINRFYGNPPYSRLLIGRFVQKAYEESQKGALVVLLLPMDSSTKYFHKYCMKAREWIIFTPRVKFLRPSGIPFPGSPKFGSFACVFSKGETFGGPLVTSRRWK